MEDAHVEQKSRTNATRINLYASNNCVTTAQNYCTLSSALDRISHSKKKKHNEIKINKYDR